MKELMKRIRTFTEDETGLETVEYAVILGLIVVGTIVLVGTIGRWVQGQFQDTVDMLPGAE